MKLMKRINMQLYKQIFGLLFMICVAGCQKQSLEKVAKEKYKLACAQLVGQHSLQDYRQALRCIDEAITCHYKVEYEALKATLLLKLGNTHESADCFSHALSKAGDSSVTAELKNNYACALAQQGFGPQARKLWREVLQDPQYLTPEVVWVNLGKWYVDNQDMKKAKLCFLKAVKLEPTYVDAHFYTALSDYALGQYRCARNQVATLLALEPAHDGGRRLAKMLASDTWGQRLV